MSWGEITEKLAELGWVLEKLNGRNNAETELEKLNQNGFGKNNGTGMDWD